jgi:uncharacterized protein YvpB
MKKNKKIILIILSFSIVSFSGWAIYDLTVEDANGEENVVKKAVLETVYHASQIISVNKGEVSVIKNTILQTVYHAVLAIPVKPAVKLAVPLHYQEHKLSCEIASLLMALNYRGVKVTESELFARLPVSFPGPRQASNIWGDPNLGFVGNVDGYMPDTGYGVYEKPIYDLAVKYRPAKIISSTSIENLITELSNGNPIVVWGVVGPGQDISWKTPGGKTINANMDEHARILIGYTGDSKNPQLMILLDPIYGELKMSIKDFLANWENLDKRAVVIN